MRFLTGKDIQQEQQDSERPLHHQQYEKQMYVQSVRPVIKTTRPHHFTNVQLNKLEEVFSKRQKPDEIQLQILAMECSLSYMDIKVRIYRLFVCLYKIFM